MKQTRTTWEETTKLPAYPALAENLRTEVAVVGGGLAGILTSYLLAKAGKKVVLLEKERLIGSTTKRTTAFLTQSVDTDFADQVDMIGESGARLVWESHGAAMSLIERIANEEGIECEFMRCPNYVYATTRSEVRALREEYRTMKDLGFDVAEKVPDLGFSHRYAFTVKNQAKYHAGKFVAGLLPKLDALGVSIYEKTEVTKMGANAPFKLIAGEHVVRADSTVTTTYHPFNNPKEVLLKKGMYKSYVMELEVPKGKYPEALYEDGDNPYQYFRIDRGEASDRMILGGGDHRVELPLKEDGGFKELEDYAEELFGVRYPVKRRWTGPILEPIDGFALIGSYDPDQYLATAFSGNGMTYSGIAALLFTDLITRKRNPWAKLYDPTRTPSLTSLWKKGRDYTEELFRGSVRNAFAARKKH